MQIDLKNNIKIACENGYDSIIPAFEDKTGIVIKNENQNFKILNNDLVHLEEKEIHRKLLLGQGSLSRNFITRQGKLLTENSNIFFNSTTNILHTIRLDTEAHNSLVNYLEKMNNIYAVLLARGGSKGLKRKNIAKLNGISLLERTINDAKNSKFINKIIVSTDDEEIKKQALMLDVNVFDREEYLSNDLATSDSVLQNIANKLNEMKDLPDLFCISSNNRTI